MFKKLFNDRKFIFIFAFLLESIFYYYFEYRFLGGDYMLPDIGLVPIIGMMFGPAGALGQCLASLIFELIEGYSIISSLLDTVIIFFISIFAYKLWYSTFKKRDINTPKFDSLYNLLKFLIIIFICSWVYWVFLNISMGVYPIFTDLYPLTDIIVISYSLNMFSFSLLFGLILISFFNVFKIPLKSPDRWIGLINIKYKYYLIGFAIIILYILLITVLDYSNPITSNIAFLLIIAESVLFCINKLDVEIKIRTTRYTIIEEIISIFLIILALTLFILFGNFETLTDVFFKNLNPNFIKIITISYTSCLVIMLSFVHIYNMERTITNPVYDLIDAMNEYKANRKLDKESELNKRLLKYLERNDDISRLINSFVLLKNNIEEDLIKIQETTAFKKRIETEFNIASKIQSNMLKTNFKEFSNGKPYEIYGFMKPAREVGGDFYDFFDLDEDNLVFDIGDVSGKGVPATMFMVKTMHLIRNHSKFHSNPQEVIENVNEISCKRNESEFFVTTWYGKLNLKSGKLKFVNAGHNKPLIKRNISLEADDSNNNEENTIKEDNNQNNKEATITKENTQNHKEENKSNENNKQFEYLDIRPNFVLGGMESVPYKEHEVDLNPGDIIFLYTDGITEANDDYEEFYGEERLKETLNKYKDESLETIIEKTKNSIYEFCSDENQFDDMTMLIIKYKGCENNE